MKRVKDLVTGDTFNAAIVCDTSALSLCDTDMWILESEGSSSCIKPHATQELVGLDQPAMYVYNVYNDRHTFENVTIRVCETGPMRFEVLSTAHSNRRLSIRRLA